MIVRLIYWLLAALRRECHDIYRPGEPNYLTRWTLLGERFGAKPSRKLFLHQFHRSDAEEHHDHPWPFLSVILWGGYYEHTLSGTRWYGPGSILTRPATWRHRIIIPEGRTCWTLVFCGPRERGWGFWCASGWIPWQQHAKNLKACRAGCGD